MSEPRTCLTCRFWQKTGTGVDNIPGICRRRAPQGAIIKQLPGPRTNNELIWPGTSSTEWCGEHESLGWTEPTVHVTDAGAAT